MKVRKKQTFETLISEEALLLQSTCEAKRKTGSQE
jgi:hypothetical protein